MIQRRAFLLALLACPAGAARAQSRPPEKILRVGMLRPGFKSPTGVGPQIKAFTEAMRQLGWIEGRNLIYDVVYGDRDEKRLHAVAAELIARRPDVIYLQGNAEAAAAFAQTRTIPIVFAAVVDPVAAGLIKSLQQPGGNVTGVSTIGWELGDKRMQLLQEALPNVKRIATLVYSPSPLGAVELALLKRAAGTRVVLIPITVSHSGALNEALSTLAIVKADAMIIPHSSFLMSERRPVIAAATKLGLPVIAHRSELADDGALMTYSSNLMDQIRRAAHLVDKVLKGTKPADIPVELPTTFELVVNLKTAKALGITIPQAVLLQASRVIE